MSHDQDRSQQIRLRCCEGNPAPPPLIQGWSRYLSLGEDVRHSLWKIVLAAVLDPASPTNEEAVRGFVRDHQLVEKELVEAVQSCGFLLSRAGALDLDVEAFCKDLETLSGGDAPDSSFLRSLYPEMKTRVRTAIVHGTLADHGKVFAGLDWRLDQVTSSDRGVHLETSVILLTLRYQDGTEGGRITLQVTPEGIRELKAFADRFAR